ncbi:MAG: hypothetical protein GWN07_36590, partial [Actinobacteria bacterium]|nr:hypothetical protein [Actinomycetota bacterium]NIS36407.1 hypothetical protein [Actinomycetota bacterium]NIU70928.1 hypothetical protein [Actinomycetota bacterium]NIW32861.1 hypothetical protein [Actinomycetota bacterium]NIX25027.1 hypothetical protein [Actinomycetota bacterium]
LTLTLERDGSDATLGPCLRWWHLRALPAPDTTQRFLVPLRLHHQESPPRGPVRVVDTLAEIEFLAELMQTQQIVTYQEGRTSYNVHIANLEHGGGTGKWNPIDHRMQGICMVEMLSVE